MLESDACTHSTAENKLCQGDVVNFLLTSGVLPALAGQIFGHTCLSDHLLTHMVNSSLLNAFLESARDFDTERGYSLQIEGLACRFVGPSFYLGREA